MSTTRSGKAVWGVVLGAVVLAASACGPASPPENLLVVVSNESRSPVSLTWRSPGLLGTSLLGGSGTEPVDACSSVGRTFGAGDEHITVTSSTHSQSFVLTGPAGGDPTVTVTLVVQADGAIAEIAGPAPSPSCQP